MSFFTSVFKLVGKAVNGYKSAIKRYVWLRWIHLAVFFQVIIGFLLIKPDLSKCVEPQVLKTELFGFKIPLGGVNLITLSMTWLIMIFLIAFSYKITRKLEEKPSKMQVVFEKLIEFFRMLCLDTLGERGYAFIPLIGTLFLIVWLSNMIGLIPIPHFEEPTANVNFTLGLGLIAFCTSHIVAIRVKGLWGWAKTYFIEAPFYAAFPIVSLISGVVYIVASKINPYYIIPLIVFMILLGYILKLFLGTSVKFYIPNPLDMIGEVGKVTSHSMRLFGNIFGGVIIMIVISKLTHYIMFPTLLSAFFGIFVGTVQAFVFAMLALVYIAVLIAEE